MVQCVKTPFHFNAYILFFTGERIDKIDFKHSARSSCNITANQKWLVIVYDSGVTN